MNRVEQVFGKKPVVLPVIHVCDHQQAIENARIARHAGADGVFLINHGIPATRLLEIYRDVARRFSTWWIGINCLDWTAEQVFQHVPPYTAGVWVDNAAIREDVEEQTEAERLLTTRQEAGFLGLYFGGVAFKAQRPVVDIAKAARLATRYVDVVTTSGTNTGRAPSPQKIELMKRAIGDNPLAVASGITPENVSRFLPWADCFLVATGIGRSFHELDAQRVESLVRQVHQTA